MKSSPNFSQRGGLTVNGAWMSWPLAKLEVVEQSFRLNGAVFTHDNIRSLHPVSGFVGYGLKIEHRNTNAPRLLIFWPLGFSRLAAALVDAGFELGEPISRRQAFGA